MNFVEVVVAIDERECTLRVRDVAIGHAGGVAGGCSFNGITEPLGKIKHIHGKSWLKPVVRIKQKDME